MSKDPDKPATLADVARRAGTSTAVVSYVMNNGPRPVAAATRERVLAAAEELGYRPNRIARALRSRTTGVVGLVLADALNPYFGALARYVEQALAGHGRLMLIGNAGYSAERQRHLVERFLAAQVDGLVIASADAGDDVAGGLGVPAVYLHNGPATGDTPLVTGDNEQAVEAAVAHLRAHGHREIAFLAGPQDTGPVGRRQQVWRAAAGDGGALLRSDYSRAAADALLRRLVAQDAVPRALIAATDEQAIGLLSAACATGLPVPGRLAVISLDGAPDSAHTAPSLTVSEQPLAAMARQAVDLLFDRTARPRQSSAVLVRRRSCGCDEG